MPLTEAEFESLLADTSKRIDGNIAWAEDEDHSPANAEKRALIASVVSQQGLACPVLCSPEELSGVDHAE